jgi:hypothetical protein
VSSVPQNVDMLILGLIAACLLFVCCFAAFCVCWGRRSHEDAREQ